MAKNRAPMLPTDALFWHAEEALPQVRLHVGGLLILDRAPDRGHLRTTLQRWARFVPRLRQRVVEPALGLGMPAWEDAPHFALNYHLREVALPPPGSQRQLLDLAGSMVVAPLDPLQPPWEVYSIAGLEGGRAACLFKLHHSIVDGVGSMALFESLTQADPADPIRMPRRWLGRDVAVAPQEWLLSQSVRNTVAGLGEALEGASQAALHPLRTANQFLRNVAALGGMIRDFNAHAVREPLADSAGDLGRRFDVLTFSLPRMRYLKEMLGVTLNDLVLTAVAGAVGRYHEHRGVPVKELECVVPINLRRANEEALGNHVGAFLIPLPVGEDDPMRRLEQIRALTTAVKGAGHRSGSRFLIQALAFVPGIAIRALSQTVSGKIGLICTNVPGPQAQRYLAGAKVECMYPFLPAVFGIPVTVALLSYGDTYAVGIATDPTAITNSALLCRYVEDAVNEIERHAPPQRAARMGPHRAHGAPSGGRHRGGQPKPTEAAGGA